MKRKLTRTGAVVALAFLGISIVLINVPPVTVCSFEVPNGEKGYWFRAIEAVAKPWLGPHHVYGVFSVPVQYRRHRLYSARLIIQGFSEAFPETSPEAGPIYGSSAEPGYYIMRVSLPTRVALWFLLTGRFGDLKTPCHWWLVIADRMK